MLNIAILASGDPESGGGGSTADRFIRDVKRGKAEVNVGLIICNNSIEKVSGFYERFETIAREIGMRIPIETINGIRYPKGKQERGQTLEESSAICRTLEDHNIDFVLGLGYCKVATGEFADTWLWQPEYAEEYPETNGIYHPNARTTNNHPGWLSGDERPDTRDTHGEGAAARAMELGIPHNAFTFQAMSAAVDEGPKIAEVLVPIHYGVDLPAGVFARTQVEEKAATAVFAHNHLQQWEEHQALRRAA
ncbi:hypothetical protein KDA00_03435 [Candidatus Saccharibacteria bacterium]|nr:hypothetical protein [Candidatus Saccharibacteria bacterium]